MTMCHGVTRGNIFIENLEESYEFELNFEQKTALEFVNVDHLISNGSLNSFSAIKNLFETPIFLFHNHFILYCKIFPPVHWAGPPGIHKKRQ